MILRQLFAALIFSSVTQAASIDIRSDADDCLNGWIGMDVTIAINNEVFRLEPSCSFFFSQDLETSEGMYCTVRAGMCSGFMPRNKLEVTCEDGSSDDIAVKCKPKKEKL